MDETDGPFAGIIRNCITTADEEELRDCPFTVEFENFPESFVSQSSPPVHSEQFGISMLSVPVTDSIDRIATSENEKLQTPPPEHQCSRTCISGSDNQRPTTATAVSACDDTAEAQVRVDLDKDNDNLGFSKPREVTVNECHGGDVLDKIDQVEYSEGDFDEPLRKRIRICEKNLRLQSSITDLEVEETVRDEVVEVNGIKRNVDFVITESEDGENHGKKHANGIKGSCCTAGVDGGRRELPLWMRGGEKNGKVEDVGRKEMKKGQFKDIIEVTMEVFGKKDSENKDEDFLENAKRRDMLFPRPRWWPPELFVD